LHEPTALFSSEFLAQLEQINLLARRLFKGEHHADRRSRATGSSTEFADYREYSLGDDLRMIDWNIYSRFDRLFVKLFEQEQDLPVFFLVDASASMRWLPPGAGSGTPSKFDLARRIAACLSYIALANLDQTKVAFFDRELHSGLEMLRGKSHFPKVLQYLLSPPPKSARETHLDDAVLALSRNRRKRGLVFMISDFLDPNGFEPALTRLQQTRFDAHAIQVLDPAELDPVLNGDYRLVDSESSVEVDFAANPTTLAEYAREARLYVEQLRSFCHARGMGHALALTNTPFVDLVLRVLRDGILLR
jgi:uncharacterized protein (DUF58 family)